MAHVGRSGLIYYRTCYWAAIMPCIRTLLYFTVVIEQRSPRHASEAPSIVERAVVSADICYSCLLHERASVRAAESQAPDTVSCAVLASRERAGPGDRLSPRSDRLPPRLDDAPP